MEFRKILSSLSVDKWGWVNALWVFWPYSFQLCSLQAVRYIQVLVINRSIREVSFKSVYTRLLPPVSLPLQKATADPTILLQENIQHYQESLFSLLSLPLSPLNSGAHETLFVPSSRQDFVSSRPVEFLQWNLTGFQSQILWGIYSHFQISMVGGKTLMLIKIEGRRRRADRGWDGWIASLTQWTWVWANSRDSEVQGSLACCSSLVTKNRHDLVIEQQQQSMGNLTRGPEVSILRGNFCALIIFKFLGHPPGMYKIWFYHICIPLTILLWFILCLWM